MDPFANDPYDSESDHEEGFQWPGVSGVSEHANALMRGDFEVSPLVQIVPPMPEAGTVRAKEYVPGIPSFSRGLPKVALKKRTADADGAHGFGGADGIIVPPPTGANNNTNNNNGNPPGQEVQDSELKPPAQPTSSMSYYGTAGDSAQRPMNPPQPYPRQDEGTQRDIAVSLASMGHVLVGAKPVMLAPARPTHPTQSQATAAAVAAGAPFTPHPQPPPPQGKMFPNSPMLDALAAASTTAPPVPLNNGGSTAIENAQTQMSGYSPSAAGTKLKSEDLLESPIPSSEPGLPTDGPSSNIGTPPRPVNDSLKGLSPGQRPSIRDIVLGSPKPSPGAGVLNDSAAYPKSETRKPLPVLNEVEHDKPDANTAKPGTDVATSARIVNETSDGAPKSRSEEGKKTRKRRHSKPSRKVLTSMKEKEQALAFVSSKDDLLDYLSKEDCFFLARELWIFTVQQLSYVLGANDYPAEAIREALLTKLSSKASLSSDQSDQKSLSAPEVAPNDMSSASGNDAPFPNVEDGSTGGDADEKRSEEGVTVKEPQKAAATTDASAKAVAEAKLREWKKIMEGFILIDKKTPPEERFPLDGPVSCLLPKAMQNFLATIPITTLFGFLQLKRTETGAICDLWKVWRSSCSLPEISLLATAKHFLGISTRLEAALSSIPPVDDQTRAWMDDPMVVMTGASKEFLIEVLDFCSAEDFVQCRTKDLAIKLVAWREAKGLAPLKGSGKVAMVSGWKALAKEAIEAEKDEGKVLKDVNLEALASIEVPIMKSDEQEVSRPESSEGTKPKRRRSSKSQKPPNPDLAKPAPAPRKLSTATMDRQAQYALHTKLFLEDVLGGDATKILYSAGVTTAAELLEMEPEAAATLSKSIRDAELADDETGSEKFITTWRDKIWNELDMMSPKRKSVASARSDGPDSPPSKKPRTKSRNSDAKPKRSSVSRVVDDPFDILSSVTRRFLSTIGIDSAEKVLTTRTTDISNEFIKWRTDQGMSELKGLGAIASVSGWKASIRKVANNLGKDGLAVLEPKNKTSWGPYSRSSFTGPKKKRSQDAPPSKLEKPEPVSREDVLEGKSRCLFAVVGLEGKFRFSSGKIAMRFEVLISLID